MSPVLLNPHRFAAGGGGTVTRVGSAQGTGTTVTYPAGSTTDDVAIVCISRGGNVAITPSTSGWNVFDSLAQGHYFAWKRLTGSDGATVTFTGAQVHGVVVYRGCADPTVGSVYNTRTNSQQTATYSLPSKSGLVAASRVVRLVSGGSGGSPALPVFSTGGITGLTANTNSFWGEGIGEQTADGAGAVPASAVTLPNNYLDCRDMVVAPA